MRGVGEEVERHIESPCQKAPGPQLCPDSPGYQGVEELSTGGFVLEGWVPTDIPNPQRQGIDVDQHRNRELGGLRINLRAYIRYLTNRDPLELHRCAHGEPADGTLKDEEIRLWKAGGEFEGLGTVLKQVELRVLIGGRENGTLGRCLECNTSDQNGEHRLGLHAETARRERHVDPAGLPEAGIGGHVLIVGRVNENLDRERLPVR